MPVEQRRTSKFLVYKIENSLIGFTTIQTTINSFSSTGKNQIQIQAGCIAHIQRAVIGDNICVLTKKMVRPSMNLFKKYRFKLDPEIAPGVCPHCEEKVTFVSIVNDYYRCMNCGTDVEQKINGVIKYLPVGKQIPVDKDHGP